MSQFQHDPGDDPIMSRKRSLASARNSIIATALLIAFAGGLVAQSNMRDTPTDTATVAEPTTSGLPEKPESSTTAGSDTILSVLGSLRIAGRAPATGYDRDQFGPAWQDVDNNGCSTRNDILTRDLTGTAIDSDCKVTTGTLDDLYTGTVIVADEPGEISDLIDIEHVVALKDAWEKGAQQLTAEQRLQLANDPLNLLAADAISNSQKGSGDAATWLPSNKDFRCQYVGIQVAVKAKYGLWVTQAEHDAITRVIADGSCEAQLVSVGSAR